MQYFQHVEPIFVIISPMKMPSKFPDVSLQTPLASGMTLASTSAPDLLLLLQQQAALLASQQQENRHLQAENERLKSLKAEQQIIQSLEEENKRLKLALAHHARMRFGIKSEVFNSQQRDLFARRCVNGIGHYAMLTINYC